MKASSYRQSWRKLTVAIFYGLCLGVALNLFWIPGRISAGGVTGLAQVIAIIFDRYLNFSIFGLQITKIMSPANLIFLINVPLFWIAWRDIGKSFTIFTFITVLMSSVMISALTGLKPITTDPMICAIFGAVINGAGIGFALRNGLSSGGTDIIGLALHKRMEITVGTVNTIINAGVVLMTGFLEGWPSALYSVVSIFISGKVLDVVYTRQQRLQVIIVTDKQQTDCVVKSIQSSVEHGITVFRDAEGAYAHQSKVVLLTIISRAELGQLEDAVHKEDRHAFITGTEVVQLDGTFVEPQI